MARAKSINVHESKRWPQADTATARALAQSVETVFFAFLLDFCFFFQQIRRWHRIREAPIGSVSIVVAKKKNNKKKESVDEGAVWRLLDVGKTTTTKKKIESCSLKIRNTDGWKSNAKLAPTSRSSPT